MIRDVQPNPVKLSEKGNAITITASRTSLPMRSWASVRPCRATTISASTMPPNTPIRLAGITSFRGAGVLPMALSIKRFSSRLMMRRTTPAATAAGRDSITNLEGSFRASRPLSDSPRPRPIATPMTATPQPPKVMVNKPPMIPKIKPNLIYFM